MYEPKLLTSRCPRSTKWFPPAAKEVSNCTSTSPSICASWSTTRSSSSDAQRSQKTPNRNNSSSIGKLSIWTYRKLRWSWWGRSLEVRGLEEINIVLERHYFLYLSVGGLTPSWEWVNLWCFHYAKLQITPRLFLALEWSNQSSNVLSVGRNVR